MLVAASMSSAPDTPILLRSMRWTTFRSLSMSPSLIDCSPTAKVPGEKLADPTLAMLCEELSRECHLLLREIDEAREVVWCYVSAGKPNAQLERTIDYVAACQVVEWGHKVIPLQRRVPAHDAAHAIGPPSIRVPGAELVVRIYCEDGSAWVLCVTLRNPAIVVENASKYYHHQVALCRSPSVRTRQDDARVQRAPLRRRQAEGPGHVNNAWVWQVLGVGYVLPTWPTSLNCRMCLMDGRIRRAAMVDHIESIAKRPDLRLDDTNLQSLCWPCHNTKTNRFDGGFGRRGGTNIGCFVGSEE